MSVNEIMSVNGTVSGIDYAWGKPDLNQVAGAGYRFICRYLSYDASKNLSSSERDEAVSRGLSIVLVWETTANRALGGYSAGMDDATAADGQARTMGMTGVPLYFAVDWDAAENEQAAINDYFRGITNIIGVNRTGAYGGYWVIKRLLDAGLIRYGWQTYAWSGGNVDSRISIYQHENGVSDYGGEFDLDYAYGADYGQWPRPEVKKDMGYFRERLESKSVERNRWPNCVYGTVGVILFHERNGGYKDDINLFLTKDASVAIYNQDGVALMGPKEEPKGGHSYHFDGYSGYVEVHCTDPDTVFERAGIN